ncbi:MAG: glycosyltransferase [Acidobacteria bacterium]|nr:glycosyltransferase [Acidobacteriota bacterium]
MRVAFVTPWFGAGLLGGAERHVFQLAARLAARGHEVEALTTCARSFSDDWSEDFYPPGVTREDGFTVRRFPVDPRDARRFDEANARLLAVAREELKPGVSPVAHEDARAFVAHNLNSSALVEHLRGARGSFRAFVFAPYLYGTTLRGVGAVAARALLQPFLHAESYAFLPEVAAAFRAARRLLFISEGERELALRLYGPGIHTRSRVVGGGVEPATGDDTEGEGRAAAGGGRATARRRDADALPAELRGARYVLYLGRRDAAKNVTLLLSAFRRFREAAKGGGGEMPRVGDLKLVLAGEGRESFHSPGEGVHDLGAVGEATKAALLAGARALFQPSRNESFSRALMESWLAARPAAAHRDCLATAAAVSRSGGGWLAASEEEWARLFAAVASAHDAELDALGARGRAYAREHADWDKAIVRYEEVFAELDDEKPAVGAGLVPARSVREHAQTIPDNSTSEDHESSSAPSRGGQGRALPLPLRSTPRVSLHAIHQLLPDAVAGDAITIHALAIRDYLRGAGLESDVFAKRREAELAGEARLVDESEIEPAAGLIYHHSIGSEVTAKALAHAGAKCLVYHNVTPPEYFAPFRPGFAWLLEAGRAHLPRLARHFPCSVGDSAFNAAELAAAGFRAPGVLPVIVSPDRWNVAPDETLMGELQDGRTNLLFVGRVAPNKRQDALVEIFAEYLKLDPKARLVVAGEGRAFDPYFRTLSREIERRGLSQSVAVTGRTSDAALLAYYRTAHLYLSASEHEGFGVPLVEAMWFDVPVLARRGTAVAETLGDAGMLFDAGESPGRVARLAFMLAHGDEELRRRTIEAQRRRREAFTPEALRPALAGLVRRMIESHAARAADAA